MTLAEKMVVNLSAALADGIRKTKHAKNKITRRIVPPNFGPGLHPPSALSVFLKTRTFLSTLAQLRD
jgi:hypothetical protein